MVNPSVEQIRSFRLRSHHLDKVYAPRDAAAVVGACGMQNTPPGAWETSLRVRIPALDAACMARLLNEDKMLVQAWSLRGAPVVFPVAESDTFLSALVPQGSEPWLYTRGITLALDALGMTFDELLDLLVRVMPGLDDRTVVSKVALDQTLADWVEPLLPVEKRDAWRQPSMYGSPDVQTVGGAAVSFLLRPCALRGLVVFAARDGASPAFTSYERWTGSALQPAADASKKLVRKFLHCYGPATADAFASWTGCSGAQARRMWRAVADEMEPVEALGKRAFVLAEDVDALMATPSFGRELLLLGGHDPYLDQRDRSVLLPDKSRHRQVWRTVANPGAVVLRGEIVGIWSGKKKGRGREFAVTLWGGSVDQRALETLVEEQAAFRQERLAGVEVRTG